MGYSTDLYGEFQCSPQLTPAQVRYLRAFATTRRVIRSEELVADLPDPLREAVDLPIGLDGAFYVGAQNLDDPFGQKGDPSVINGNNPPGSEIVVYLDAYGRQSYQDGATPPFKPHLIREAQSHKQAQPGLWNQWTVPEGDDGTVIAWDGGEKFYHYIEWIAYMVVNFFDPWGVTLNGTVDWQGEEPTDRGQIRVENNEVFFSQAQPTYPSFRQFGFDSELGRWVNKEAELTT